MCEKQREDNICRKSTYKGSYVQNLCKTKKTLDGGKAHLKQFQISLSEQKHQKDNVVVTVKIEGKKRKKMV